MRWATCDVGMGGHNDKLAPVWWWAWGGKTKRKKSGEKGKGSFLCPECDCKLSPILFAIHFNKEKETRTVPCKQNKGIGKERRRRAKGRYHKGRSKGSLGHRAGLMTIAIKGEV